MHNVYHSLVWFSMYSLKEKKKKTYINNSTGRNEKEKSTSSGGINKTSITNKI